MPAFCLDLKSDQPPPAHAAVRTNFKTNITRWPTFVQTSTQARLVVGLRRNPRGFAWYVSAAPCLRIGILFPSPLSITADVQGLCGIANAMPFGARADETCFVSFSSLRQHFLARTAQVIVGPKRRTTGTELLEEADHTRDITLLRLVYLFVHVLTSLVFFPSLLLFHDAFSLADAFVRYRVCFHRRSWLHVEHPTSVNGESFCARSNQAFVHSYILNADVSRGTM